MEALKIEVLNPKALQLIKGMQELKLIIDTNLWISFIITTLPPSLTRRKTTANNIKFGVIGQEIQVSL